MRLLLATLCITCLLIPIELCSQQTSTVTPELSDSIRIVQWDLDGSGSWRIAHGRVELWKAGVPAGKIRRPAALAIFKSKPFCRITLEAEVRSTAPLDVVRRDIDLILAYESASRFYYVHLAGISDSVHNGIFLVNNANRVRIDGGKGLPQLKDSTWHHVRVERDGLTGLIEVFVDRSRNPVLEARDGTIRCGRVGFGSFDDTGEFRHISMTGIEQ